MINHFTSHETIVLTQVEFPSENLKASRGSGDHLVWSPFGPKRGYILVPFWVKKGIPFGPLLAQKGVPFGLPFWTKRGPEMGPGF